MPIAVIRKRMSVEMEGKRFEVGTFATSLAGHDTGKTFLIIEEREQEVLLADGKSRTMEKPKRKKKKHLMPIKLESGLAEKCKDQSIRNEEIRKAIKKAMQYCQNENV